MPPPLCWLATHYNNLPCAPPVHMHIFFLPAKAASPAAMLTKRQKRCQAVARAVAPRRAPPGPGPAPHPVHGHPPPHRPTASCFLHFGSWKAGFAGLCSGACGARARMIERRRAGTEPLPPARTHAGRHCVLSSV